MTVLFIVDHCQTLLGKSGYKQETKCMYNSLQFICLMKTHTKDHKNEKCNAIADM